MKLKKKIIYYTSLVLILGSTLIYSLPEKTCLDALERCLNWCDNNYDWYELSRPGCKTGCSIGYIFC